MSSEAVINKSSNTVIKEQRPPGTVAKVGFLLKVRVIGLA